MNLSVRILSQMTTPLLSASPHRKVSLSQITYSEVQMLLRRPGKGKVYRGYIVV